MVRPKHAPKPTDWLKESMERIDRDHPIVDTRYYVVEIRPPYITDYAYDTWSEKQVTVVSPYFKTKEEALDWFSEHEPDAGNTLKVITQHKRRTVTEAWW